MSSIRFFAVCPSFCRRLFVFRVFIALGRGSALTSDVRRPATNLLNTDLFTAGPILVGYKFVVTRLRIDAIAACDALAP